MCNDFLQPGLDPPAGTRFESLNPRALITYERELLRHRNVEKQLRTDLARSIALNGQKDFLLQQQDILTKESDHRLMNDLQMIVSLFSMQSRNSTDPISAAQFAVAANRVGMIARLHQRLHQHDGAPTISFKKYLKELCQDLSAMVPAGRGAVQLVVEDGAEIDLSTAIGIPLGFIVSELLTNAIKYGNGGIVVTLEAAELTSYTLSVSNDGAALPEGFDPGAGKGLGMKIIKSFVERIGGELRFGRNDDNQGTRFTVLFSDRKETATAR